jgi:methionyl aminopeptidase
MIILKSHDEIEKMRRSGAIVAEVLTELRGMVKPGVRTIDLDKRSEELTRKKGANPAFKGYRGFPFSLCASINSEVVHGMPSDRFLKEGEIISLDFCICYEGYYGDAAITVPVGQVSDKSRKLINVTEEALYQAIDKARVGNRLGDISSEVQRHVEAFGFSVVRDYVGHGIGRQLHEDPQIPNFGKKGRGVELRPGMVFAIEPMVNEGSYDVRVLQDGWTVVTEDGRLSAHFEHTVAITENGPEILSEI